MKMSFGMLKSWLKRLALPLPAALSAAWWVILLLLLAVLAADGFVFYQFGLGRAAIPADGGSDSVLRLREDTIRAAAKAIRERRDQFQSATTTPKVQNPFQ